MSTSFYVPEIPYSPIDALNRRAAALGSPGYAQASHYANYNGHSISVSWNDYRGYYITQYYYGERVVLSRGSFRLCLDAALREYGGGALGTSITVAIKEGDTEAQTICEACPELHAGEINQADRSWYTWRHKCAASSARDSANPRALRMHFDWNLLQTASTEEEYEAALTAKYGRAWTF